MAVVTISRQVGSGGDEIAQLVARRLGYQIMDGELIAKLGPQLGLTAPGEVVDLSAERHHVPSALERAFVVMPSLNAPAFNDYLASGEADADRSYSVISQIIRYTGAQGNAVLEGRGSMLELKDNPGALHVRVVAPVEQRVAYVARRDGIAANAALGKVKEADAAQAAYILRYYASDISDATLYHLIVNTARVPLEEAVAVICDWTTRLAAQGRNA